MRQSSDPATRTSIAAAPAEVNARLSSPAVTPRLRVYAAVGTAALAAAGATIGITLATRTPTPSEQPAQPRSRAGAPPLVLDLGVRDDAEARALRRAEGLYDAGKRRAAGRIFG